MELLGREPVLLLVLPADAVRPPVEVLARDLPAELADPAVLLRGVDAARRPPPPLRDPAREEPAILGRNCHLYQNGYG